MKQQDLGSKPVSTSADAVDAIVEISKRKKTFPIRRAFLQQEADGAKVKGPLAELVRTGDGRALTLYLLLVTKASADPWNAALPAAAWARALGIALPDSKSARSTISKVWLRLERLKLVERKRKQRLADVFLLREDGSGDAYKPLGGIDDLYFKVPLGLWTDGPNSASRWYEVLTVPEVTMLLIGRSLGDQFRLPAESAPDWYGISADTVSRGLTGLESRGLLTVDKTYKKAPLSAVGYTAEHRYTLQAPFGPVGRRSGARAPRKRKASPPVAKRLAQATPVPRKSTKPDSRRRRAG